MDSNKITLEDIKIGVAVYSIQRRVLEVLYATLQAHLLKEHCVELERFKEDLKAQAPHKNVNPCLQLRRRQVLDCAEGPKAGGGLVSAYAFICRKVELAKFKVLQVKERRKAAKKSKDELDGLRREFGDWIIPWKNGGITEADCAKERCELLLDWGLASLNSVKNDRQWEDDLRKMVNLTINQERGSRNTSRLEISGETLKKELSYTQLRRLSMISESSKEE